MTKQRFINTSLVQESYITNTTADMCRSIMRVRMNMMKLKHGGGGSRLNFGQGCAAHCFKIAPLARPIFLKMIPLARLISTSKCHELAFSRQNLPNFCILWTKIWVSLQELPKFDISLTKIAKKYTLAQTKWAKIGKKHTLG